MPRAVVLETRSPARVRYGQASVRFRRAAGRDLGEITEPPEYPVGCYARRRGHGMTTASEPATAAGAIFRLLGRVTTSGRFLPEVDGLRFVAIVAVLLAH